MRTMKSLQHCLLLDAGAQNICVCQFNLILLLISLNGSLTFHVLSVHFCPGSH